MKKSEKSDFPSMPDLSTEDYDDIPKGLFDSFDSDEARMGALVLGIFGFIGYMIVRFFILQ